MGRYLNPGNEAFAEIIAGKYIDKTGMINIINNNINKSGKLMCLSRPRRFGKSFTAQMLCAYYDCTCDSHSLFDRYEISKFDTYEDYMNQYNVMVVDVTGFLSKVKKSNGKLKLSDVPEMISNALRDDLAEDLPELAGYIDLEDCLYKYVKLSGKKFVFIIDEWDALIREAKEDDNTQQAYLNLLRGLFKNSNITPYVVAAAYMTGILPIKKDGSQSAISDFEEYTFLNPGPFGRYTGFTEDEVSDLCRECNMDYELMKQWYDGYEFDGIGSIYNPYSVMETIKLGDYSSHWQKTSVAESLVPYINMNYDGLQEDIIKLLADEHVRVNARGFKNDFVNFSSKDDVLTLLVHLGYLSYNKNTERVRIPNGEVRIEFTDILKNPKHTQLYQLIHDSEVLLSDTLAGNEEAVAKAIESVRETNYAPQFYNNEQALRYAIKFAYIVCVDRFMRIEELPSGRGLADVVFVPSRDTAYPAIIIELKWEKDTEEAIDQINEKRYDAVLSEYSGEIVKVGINYDSGSKVHGCRICRVEVGDKILFAGTV